MQINNGDHFLQCPEKVELDCWSLAQLPHHLLLRAALRRTSRWKPKAKKLNSSSSNKWVYNVSCTERGGGDQLLASNSFVLGNISPSLLLVGFSVSFFLVSCFLSWKSRPEQKFERLNLLFYFIIVCFLFLFFYPYLFCVWESEMIKIFPHANWWWLKESTGK